MRLLVAALALPAALAAQTPADTAPRPVTVDEAVALAQRNAPSVVQSLGQVQTSRAEVRSAYGAFIPSLTLSASSSHIGGAGVSSQRVDPTTGALVDVRGSAWRYSNGVQLALDLFDGGARLNNLRSSRAGVTAAVANDVSERFAIALQVKQQYYAVLAAREADSAARTQLAEAEAQLRASTLKLHAGSATKSDSLRSVIQVGNAQLALLTARNDLQTANATLTRLVGTPYTVTAAAEPPGELLQPVDSAALEHLAESGPAVRLALANESAASAASRAARGSYFPTLSAGFGISGNGTAIDQYEYQNQFRIGLSWPVFNQFTRELQVARADVAERNAEASLRDARLLARQNLVQYLGAIRTAQQQVTIQTTSVAAAEEDLRVQRQRYDLGASTLLDVLTSETALIQARAALITARFDYRVAKAQLEALVGQPLPMSGTK